MRTGRACVLALAILAASPSCGPSAKHGWDYGLAPDAPPVHIGQDEGAGDPAPDGRDGGDLPAPGPDYGPEVQVVDATCTPNQRTCKGNTSRVCSGDGTQWIEMPCGDLLCIDGECLTCPPGVTECSALNEKRTCNEYGTDWEDVVSCGDEKCVGGQCVLCVPGTGSCDGSKVMRCAADASAWEFVEDCDTENTGRLCQLGMCLDLCAYNEKFKTNLGCEYWAIDMDQSQEYDGANSPYAIVVSNTNEGFAATVTVSKVGGVVTTVHAPAKTATIINLDPFNIVGVGQTPQAYRITSNVPIVAYQFNPLENVGVFSNDASLLLPTNALGRRYYVMAWPHRPGLSTLASNFAVVAAEAVPVSVTIHVTAKTAAGGTVPALNAGDAWTTTLQPYDVLNIETVDAFTDLTGSYVESDGRVALFGGHVCANVPLSTCKGGHCAYDPGIGCGSDGDCPIIAACDHLEEQIQPQAAWGQDYVIGRTWPRGKAPDVVRVLSGEDGTQVTVFPPVATVPILNRGQSFDFEIQDSVEVKASKNFLVGQYLEGQDAPGSAHQACEEVLFASHCDGNPLGPTCDTDQDCSPDDANIGDPSFMVGVPVEQFRQEYVFLVPTKYALNYVNVVGPPGTVATLDGGPLPVPFSPMVPQGWALARFPLAAGSHSLSADHKVGVLVYGWDQYVSYGYPGGMNVESLQVVQ